VPISGKGLKGVYVLGAVQPEAGEEMPIKSYSAKEAEKASVSQLMEDLSTKQEGLSSPEAAERAKQFGYNEIPEKKVNPILAFLRYFWGPIPWMIEAAIILSAVISRWEDFGIIMVLLMMNAIVGFWQERKADNAIEMLKKRLALKARVRRDGAWKQVASKELVPGDIIRVRLGEIVPADAKLFEGDYLILDESALTGESLPAEKHQSDVAYSGSAVKQGEMNAVVFATGLNSYFGKTTKLVEEAKTQSHFQKAVVRIGNYLIFLAISLAIVVVSVALLRHESFVDTIRFALVLTVAAIPAALPAVLSVTLAVGAIALAKKEAIVSKLVSIEELAGMDVLCSDKTGTITKNELRVARQKIYDNHTEAETLLYAVLASREEDQDPIDSAIIEKARSVEGVEADLKKYKQISFTPFDPVKKRTEAEVEDGSGKRFKVSKGAPQAVYSLLAKDESFMQGLAKDLDDLGSKGFRPLGVARTAEDGRWEYVGLLGLQDPPREDSKATIKTAESMRIDVKMVTGDHVAIAKEIAEEMDLGTDIITSESFVDKPDAEATKVVEKADGFAQVFPEHKYRIVELLQKEGHIVGMTGDGVNDAPALKKADAGIAVAGATDAAKSAADIVLTKPGLSVIIDSIKESRKIFQRMKSYAIYRIAETIRVLFFIVMAIIVFNFYPVTAIMIVLLAVFNDAPIMTIAYDNVRYSNYPERWDMREVLIMSTFLGLIGVVFSFMIYYIARDVLNFDQSLAQSFIFLKLAVAGHLTIFVSRTRGHFWSIRPSKALFWSAVGTKFLATLVAVYGVFITGIGWEYAGLVWGYALAAFVITDYLKVFLYRYLDSRAGKNAEPSAVPPGGTGHGSSERSPA
jgi:H+-transporting ATPase